MKKSLAIATLAAFLCAIPLATAQKLRHGPALSHPFKLRTISTTWAVKIWLRT